MYLVFVASPSPHFPALSSSPRDPQELPFGLHVLCVHMCYPQRPLIVVLGLSVASSGRWYESKAFFS